MTWEPKNKTDDDDDAMLSDDDKEKDELDGPHHMDKQRDHKGKVNLPFFTFIPHLIFVGINVVGGQTDTLLLGPGTRWCVPRVNKPSWYYC